MAINGLSAWSSHSIQTTFMQSCEWRPSSIILTHYYEHWIHEKRVNHSVYSRCLVSNQDTPTIWKSFAWSCNHKPCMNNWLHQPGWSSRTVISRYFYVLSALSKHHNHFKNLKYSHVIMRTRKRWPEWSFSTPIDRKASLTSDYPAYRITDTGYIACI